MRASATMLLVAASCSAAPPCDGAAYYVRGVCVLAPELERGELERYWRTTATAYAEITGDDCPSIAATAQWCRDEGVSLSWSVDELEPSEDGCMRRYSIGVDEDLWLLVRPGLTTSARRWILVHEYLHLLRYRCTSDDDHDGVILSPTLGEAERNGSLDYEIAERLCAEVPR